MRFALIALIVLVFGGSAAAQTAPPSALISGKVAVLRGLDKVTGKARDFDAPIGKPTRFGTLEIVVRACRRAPADYQPEVAVYLEVRDFPRPRPNQAAPEPREIHQGWIFASSPGINGLEHPVYDVWAISCKS